MSARWVRWALALLLDARSMETMIEPLLADAWAEHRQAVAEGRRLEARWIVARTAWDLVVALLAILALSAAERVRATRWRLPLAGLAVALLGIASLGELGGRQMLQACWLGVGAVMSALVLLLPARWLSARRAWFLIAMLLLAWVGFAGETYDGATRWVALGPLRLMPSELARPALLLAIAGALASRRAPRLSRVARQPEPWSGGVGGRSPLTMPRAEGALMTALAVGALAWQPDPGAAAVLLVAAAVMFSDAAGLRGAVFGVAPAAASFVAIVVVRSTSLASAWTSGTMAGKSPATDTDFWLAGVEGRFGVGAALIALLLIGLLARELWTSGPHTGSLRSIARGAAAALVSQAALHATSALGLLPPSTLGLPLLSYGGSGMVGWMLCLMIVARLAGSGYRASQPSSWQMQ